MKFKSLVWSDCPYCRAPQTRPLPEGWSYTSVTRSGLSRVTPHLPNCRKGFKKVELPDDDE